jgi:hypothetical protein
MEPDEHAPVLPIAPELKAKFEKLKSQKANGTASYWKSLTPVIAVDRASGSQVVKWQCPFG